MAKHIYNKIYSPQEYKIVNITNKEIINDYIEEIKQRKLKKTTITQYYNDLRIFSIFVKKQCENISFLELTKKDFRRLSIWLSDECKMSNARTNRLLSSCRALLTYCEDSDDYEYDNNIARKVKGLPNEPVKTDEDTYFISFDQITNIRQNLLNTNKIQLAVLHMMFFDSGARRNEVAQVQKYGLLNGNKTNIVVGKRGKNFPLVYLNDTKELIKLWLDKRGDDNIDSLWVVGSGTNKRKASYAILYDWILKIRKIFSSIEGRQINIFPHSYRHSRCESLLQGTDTRIIDSETGQPKKFSLEQVQLFLHHSDPKTTQGYTKDHSEEIINNMFGI